jgi:hypothetical protein
MKEVESIYEDLQSVAEAVHLAIKLLEGSRRASSNRDRNYAHGQMIAYCELALLELKPAMMALAPYMPNYSESANHENEAQGPIRRGEGLPALRNAPDGPTVENERGFLDGTDEQSFAKRHS